MDEPRCTWTAALRYIVGITCALTGVYFLLHMELVLAIGGLGISLLILRDEAPVTRREIARTRDKELREWNARK